MKITFSIVALVVNHQLLHGRGPKQFYLIGEGENLM